MYYLVNQRSEWEKGRKKGKVAKFTNYMRIRIIFITFFPREISQWVGYSAQRESPNCPLILMPDCLTPLIEANNNNLHLLSTHCQETPKHIINVMCCDRHYYPARDIATNHSIINLQIPENQRVLDENKRGLCRKPITSEQFNFLQCQNDRSER